MIKAPPIYSLAWLAVLCSAGGFLLWMNVVRVRHIEHVSTLGGWNGNPPIAVPDPAPVAPELVAGNGLIVPGQLTESYHWLAQTQRMFNRGEWRVRHIDYENAPFGRAVYSPSPYRWWLGAIAWCDHVFSGRSPAQAVERAALVADPLLHVLLLLGTTIFVAWRFGALPAALISIGCVTLFPFAAGYLPAAPDDRGLAQILALWSVLLLAAGVRATPAPDDNGKSTRRWFILAGITGGLGLWVRVSVQIPILVGVAGGALLAAWVMRNHRRGEAAASTGLPWRSWAAAGAITTLIAYLIEFAPAYLGDWQLSYIHPLYGLAWLGGGEILAQTAEWIERRRTQPSKQASVGQRPNSQGNPAAVGGESFSVQGQKPPKTIRNFAVLACALAAIVAVPVANWKIHGSEFLLPDTPSLRLTKLPEGAIAQNLAAWISRDGLTLAVWATFLPLVLVASAGWVLLRQQSGRERQISVAITLGPVLVAFGFACQQLVWWNTLDGLLLVMVAAATTGLSGAANRGYRRLAWAGGGLLLLLPGILLVAPRPKAETEEDLTRSEVLGLIERDLAGWLALHGAPGGVVLLAPPNETTALCYYGGMRGLGSISRENKSGVAAAMLILGNPNPQEAKALIDRRDITHLVLLSWDSEFDDYTRAGPGQSAATLRDKLQLPTLPLWLRPLAYSLPKITGFEGQSVQVFEVVDEQEPATAVARITEYLVETRDLEQAAAAAQGLRRFPADFGAWVARAEVDSARGDEEEFAKSLKVLEARLAAKYPAVLPWDLRVGLAVVLARAKKEQLAREQVAVCLATADKEKLRELSPGSLYRLLVLSRAFGNRVDPKLHEFALTLVPTELRDRLR
ncbi:MAG TPA: hypothetical protein VGM73_11915 [Candidatus Didemnitutus sp.]|jgi:hypothetical protein